MFKGRNELSFKKNGSIFENSMISPRDLTFNLFLEVPKFNIFPILVTIIIHVLSVEKLNRPAIYFLIEQVHKKR